MSDFDYFSAYFRSEVMPWIFRQEAEWQGTWAHVDGPLRREAWNNSVDAWIEGGDLPEAEADRAHPCWLETDTPQND